MGGAESSDEGKGAERPNYGSIVIEIRNNTLSFEAGSLVSGTVHVSYENNFPASSLTLGLHGLESTNYYKMHLTHTTLR